MDYKPLYELLLSGALKKVRLSQTALKRMMKQTDFFARHPGAGRRLRRPHGPGAADLGIRDTS